jgi:hypothetical protein
MNEVSRNNLAAECHQLENVCSRSTFGLIKPMVEGTARWMTRRSIGKYDNGSLNPSEIS